MKALLLGSMVALLTSCVTLREAVQKDDVPRVTALLADGADVEDQGRWGDKERALYVAAGHGNLAIATALLNHGAKVNARDYKTEGTPLHQAAAGGSAAMVTLLLAHGAEINARDWEGRTPLHHAAQRISEGVIKELLSHGAEVDARDKGHRTPLHILVASYDAGDKVAAVEAMVSHGADVNAIGTPTNPRDTPLGSALEPAVIAVLQAHGATGSSGADQVAQSNSRLGDSGSSGGRTQPRTAPEEASRSKGDARREEAPKPRQVLCGSQSASYAQQKQANCFK